MMPNPAINIPKRNSMTDCNLDFILFQVVLLDLD